MGSRRHFNNFKAAYQTDSHFRYCMQMVIILVVFSLVAFCSLAKAEEIPTETAVHCILGEVRGQIWKYGDKSYLALAEALRNRGTTQGVYGCSADFSREMSYIKKHGLDKKALEAWQKSKHTNITKGAIYFLSGKIKSDRDLANRLGRNGAELTAQIGDIFYYK